MSGDGPTGPVASNSTDQDASHRAPPPQDHRTAGRGPSGCSTRRREARAAAHRLRGVLGERWLLAHEEARTARAADHTQVAAAVAQAIGERRRVSHGGGPGWPGPLAG